MLSPLARPCSPAAESAGFTRVTTNPPRGDRRARSPLRHARRRAHRRRRIRAIPSDRHRHRPRPGAAGDRSLARRGRDPDRSKRATASCPISTRTRNSRRAMWSRAAFLPKSPPGAAPFSTPPKAVGAAFPEKFPNVAAACRSAGIDPARQPIPVAPAEHYHMGGIVDGRATAGPRCPACGRRARSPRPACMAPTASLPIPCSKPWFSATASRRDVAAALAPFAGAPSPRP